MAANDKTKTTETTAKNDEVVVSADKPSQPAHTGVWHKPIVWLAAVLVVAVIAALAAIVYRPLQAGIQLNGPQTVVAGTDYTYHLQIVTGKSYKNASILVMNPTSYQSMTFQHVSLSPRKAWKTNIKLRFYQQSGNVKPTLTVIAISNAPKLTIPQRQIDKQQFLFTVTKPKNKYVAPPTPPASSVLND